MKLEKISKIALLSTICVSVLCFLLFWLVDYDNMDFDGKHVSPALTDLIIWLMYILLAAMVGLAAWSMVRGISINRGNTGPSPTGIAGGTVVVATWGTVIACLVIGLLCGLGEEPFTTVSGKTTEAGWVTVTDMWLIALYILAVIAIAAIVVSMSGVLTKSATPKE